MSSDKLQALRSTSAAKTRFVSDEHDPNTTNSGVQRGHALYDTPSTHPQPEPLQRSQRSRTQTDRLAGHIQQVEATRRRSGKIQRSKARKARRARRTGQGTPHPAKSQGRADDDESDINESGESAAEDEFDINLESEQEEYSNSDSEMDDTDKEAVHSRSRAALLETLSTSFHPEDLALLPTEELQEMLAAVRDDQATAVGIEREYPQIKLLPMEDGTKKAGEGGAEAVSQPREEGSSSAGRPAVPAKRPLAPPPSESQSAKHVRLLVDTSNQSSSDSATFPPAVIPPPSFPKPKPRPPPGMSQIPPSRAGPSSVARPPGLPQSRAGPNATQTASAHRQPLGPRALPITNPEPPSSRLPTTRPNGQNDAQEDMRRQRREVLLKRSRSLFDTRRHRRHPDPPPPLGSDFLENLTDLLNDDDEQVMEEEAIAQGKVPVGRKKKPAARNFSGNIRLVLTLAILNLLAYLVAEGPYENRETYWIWALEAFERCWREALPDIPYEQPPDDVIRVIVNRVATYRGKVKERVRAIVEHMFGLKCPPLSEEDAQHNRGVVRRMLPNTFHCLQFNPRSGHYENPAICRALALAIFYKSDAIGVLYRDYFDPLPLPTMGFVLTTLQCCFNEWATGWFVRADLNATEQYGMYVSHMHGLQEYGRVAGRRLRRFQEEWFEYGMSYSGAESANTTARFAQEVTLASEIRPDTPVPFDDDEEDLTYTGMDIDEVDGIPDEQEAPPAVEEEEEEPPVEYDENGRLTARSKGKGRATQ